MKTIYILFTVSILFVTSCKKDEEACYVFTTTTVTKVTPSTPGYPQTSTTTTEQCGLTEDEAKEVNAGLTGSSTTTSGGITATVTMTSTYRKK